MASPPALPPNVVAQVWRACTARHTEQPALRPGNAELHAFVTIAIAAPHYAGVLDIATALGEPRQRINRIKMRIVREAREDRNRGHDTPTE